MNLVELERRLFSRLHRRTYTVAVEFRAQGSAERYAVREVRIRAASSKVAELYAAAVTRADGLEVGGVWTVWL